mmetsp:Transcript_13894/g.40633  ORF Transcript_13894/g.40633 Transcript_13894/m.40633 type:complete len:348 (-) Transcript_13894:326-1369(-)
MALPNMMSCSSSRSRRPIYLLLLCCAFPLPGVFGFVRKIGSSHRRQSRAAQSSNLDKGPSLNLVPLHTFGSEATFLSSPESQRACIDENGTLRPDDVSPYALCLAEEDDLPSISQLTIDAFGADAITLSQDLSQFERALLEPSIGAFNAYTGVVAYTEVLSGLRSRMKDRLHNVDLTPPPVKDISDSDAETVAAKSSLILAIARPKEGGQSGIDVIASVELRLQPVDGKIPFSQPWLDGLERKAAKVLDLDLPPRDTHLQPYLSNLCVAKSARGRRIGKALVRCVENIATDTWDYSKIYLHVDLENVAATNLYRGEGYEDVGFRWNPFWAGAAADIGYYVKNLKPSR